MKPRASTATPAASARMRLPFGTAADGHSTRSNTCGAGAPLPSNVTRRPSFAAATRRPSCRAGSLVARAMRFSSGRTRSRSQPGISASVSSTTLTFAPSASYTVAISRPMMPPPITSSRFGMSASSSAPVESMTRGSSGRPGMRTDSEPAAMMHCSKPTTCFLPSASPHLDAPRRDEPCRCRGPLRPCAAWRGSRGRRSACRRPCSSTAQLRRHRSSAPNLMPCTAIDSASSMTLAACSSALDGMQPTFRQTPPSCGQRSTSVTLRPRSAARNAAV